MTIIDTFPSMIGKTMTSVETHCCDEEMIFTSSDGHIFTFEFKQQCCSQGGIEDIIGDLTDLVGSPILLAEKISSEAPPEASVYDQGSSTWTFYRYATIKGTVTVRWFATSNGNYSEEIWFQETRKEHHPLPSPAVHGQPRGPSQLHPMGWAGPSQADLQRQHLRQDESQSEFRARQSRDHDLVQQQCNGDPPPCPRCGAYAGGMVRR